MGPKQALDDDRGGFLLNLFLAAVTGFNALLLIQHAIRGNSVWFILILLLGFLLPGALPFVSFMNAVRAGRARLLWRPVVAGIIGAVDCWAILTQFPGGLEDLSWVSLYIIVNAMAFIGLARTR